MPIRLSVEQIRQRKSAAFSMFNQRRGELTRARRRVDVARAALGQPFIAVVEKRCAVTAVLRASKHDALVHFPIVFIAAHVA